MILEASPYHVAMLAILAEPNCDYPAQDQVVGISLAPPARGGLQGLQWALMNLFIDASIDRLWRIGELPVAAGNNAANRGSSAIASVACLACINLGM